MKRRYSTEKRVIAEEVYDSIDLRRYTVFRTDYDPQGHVIRKTDPLGHENTYTYDSLGNLLTAKEVSSPLKNISL